MKKIIAIAFLMTSISSNAQFGLSAGLRSGLIGSKTFTQFRNSYSSYLESSLKKPVSAPAPGIGWAFGIDYEILNIYSFLNFSQTNNFCNAKFNDGAERHFKVNQFLSTVGIGYGMVDDISFGLGVGLAFGNDVVKSSFTYTNGVTSYANDKDLNGVYDRIHTGYMAHAYIAFGGSDGFQVYGKLEYVFGVLGGLRSGLDDIHPHKSRQYVGEAFDVLPTDYETYINQLNTWDYDDEQSVQNDFSGIRIELGVRFQFGEDL